MYSVIHTLLIFCLLLVFMILFGSGCYVYIHLFSLGRGVHIELDFRHVLINISKKKLVPYWKVTNHHHWTIYSEKVKLFQTGLWLQISWSRKAPSSGSKFLEWSFGSAELQICGASHIFDFYRMKFNPPKNI